MKYVFICINICIIWEYLSFIVSSNLIVVNDTSISHDLLRSSLSNASHTVEYFTTKAHPKCSR